MFNQTAGRISLGIGKANLDKGNNIKAADVLKDAAENATCAYDYVTVTQAITCEALAMYVFLIYFVFLHEIVCNKC